jgi:asparagine synthase (glutamine-hydrolysing)
MIDILAHRGPDDRGSYVHIPRESVSAENPAVALGHRRLAIIGLADGQQPQSNEDGGVRVVFNGEIYNHRSLRRRLEAAGHQFRTTSDTECLVHLYEAEGLHFVQHLVGMFALALWDEKRRRLVLVRDRLGQKPLLYRLEENRLLLASELKSMLEVPGVPRTLDIRGLDEYLAFNHVTHLRSILDGFSKLPPGHLGVYEKGRLEVQPYWTPDFDDQFDGGADQARRRLEQCLTNSVRSQLNSDVPVGTFLSGGVDSSVITALAQQAAPRRLKTFSIGFTDPGFDESDAASRVARHLGTEHHSLRLEPNVLEMLPKLVWHFDEPFGGSSAVPTYLVSEFAAQHVKVVLSGDGGDELFAGYNSHRSVARAAQLSGVSLALRKRMRELGFALDRMGGEQAPWHRAARLLQRCCLTPQRVYLEWKTTFRDADRAALFEPEFAARLLDHHPVAFLEQAWRRAERRDPIAQASLTDLVTYLPTELMTKTDIASMAHGLECRAPFLDHFVVELACSLPTRWKFRRGRGKRILEEVFGERVPRFVFRRPKQGFGIPLTAWLSGEGRSLLHDVLLDSRALERGYFRPEAVRRLVRDFEASRGDHARRLWSLLILELWHRQWLDPAPDRSASPGGGGSQSFKVVRAEESDGGAAA